MGNIETQMSENLGKKIEVNMRITNDELTAIKEALRKDRNTVIALAKSGEGELSDFLMREYYFMSEKEVKKEGVRAFQSAVGLVPDGKYGPKTFEAVVNFQAHNGLKVDGIIGKTTLEKATGKKAKGDQADEPRNETRTRRQKGESVDTGKEEYNFDVDRAEKILNQKINAKTQETLSLVFKCENNPREIVLAIARFQKVSDHYKGEVDGIFGKNTKIAAQKDGLIKNDDGTSEKKENETPMTPEENKKTGKKIKSAEKFNGLESLSERWQKIFWDCMEKLNANERNDVEAGRKPVALVDSRTNKLLFIDGKKQISISVILGENGTTTGGYVEQDKKTPVGMVHRFGTVKFGSDVPKSWLRKGQPYKPELLPADNATWSDLVFNEKNQCYTGFKNGKKGKRMNVTVTGFSMQSPESMAYGGRYFHGTGPWRNKTWGCVGMSFGDYEKSLQIAKTIAAKRGFGYVS